MKSELKEEKPKDLLKLPAFYKDRASSLVVLFNETKYGMVVVPNPRYILGHTNYWSSCDDEDIWQRLPSGSQVILTQD